MNPRRIYRNVVTASLLALALGLGGCVVGASSYYPEPGPLANDFWYYPSVGVYYDNQQGYYHYNSGGTWVETTVLPSYLYSGLGTYVVLDNPGPRPWYYYNDHRHYYPPERYRHYPPNPPPPRYGHKPRWDDDKHPGDRPPPSGGRTPPGYYRPGGDNFRPGYKPPGDNPVWPGSRPPGGDRSPPGQGPRPTPRPQPWQLGDDPGLGDRTRTNEFPHSQGPGQVYPSRPVGNRPNPQPQPRPMPPARTEPPRVVPGGSPLGPYTPPAHRPSGQIPAGKPRVPRPSSGDTSSEPVSGPFGGQGPSSGNSPRPRPGPLAEY